MVFVPWFRSLTLLSEVMGDCEMLVGHWIYFFFLKAVLNLKVGVEWV